MATYTVRVLPRVADLIFSVVLAAVGVCCANSGAVAQSAATNRSVFTNVNNQTKGSKQIWRQDLLDSLRDAAVDHELQVLSAPARDSSADNRASKTTHVHVVRRAPEVRDNQTKCA